MTTSWHVTKTNSYFDSNWSNYNSDRKRSTLTVSDVAARDGGIYTCQATNIAGTSSHATHVTIRNTLPTTHQASDCPIHSYCLNGGSCLYYHSIGELVCRSVWAQCPVSFRLCCSGAVRASQDRGVSSKRPWNLNTPEYQAGWGARLTRDLNTDCLIAGCGAYGYDINQLCSAWREAPEEMTKEQYEVGLTLHLLSTDHSPSTGMEADSGNRNELKEEHDATVKWDKEFLGEESHWYLDYHHQAHKDNLGSFPKSFFRESASTKNGILS